MRVTSKKSVVTLSEDYAYLHTRIDLSRNEKQKRPGEKTNEKPNMSS